MFWNNPKDRQKSTKIQPFEIQPTLYSLNLVKYAWRQQCKIENTDCDHFLLLIILFSSPTKDFLAATKWSAKVWTQENFSICYK